MSLNISGATSGYDVSGMQSLINEVKIKFIVSAGHSRLDALLSWEECAVTPLTLNFKSGKIQLTRERLASAVGTR